MYYVIIAHDAEDSAETRPLYRQEHRERLMKRAEEGRLLLAAPFPDYSARLIILAAEP